jgi:hypothetical protein
VRELIVRVFRKIAKISPKESSSSMRRIFLPLIAMMRPLHGLSPAAFFRHEKVHHHKRTGMRFCELVLRGATGYSSAEEGCLF